METLVPLAIGGAVIALFAPARRRVVPVAKAVAHVGTGIAGVTVAGMKEIAGAAVRGEETPGEPSAEVPAEKEEEPSAETTPAPPRETPVTSGETTTPGDTRAASETTASPTQTTTASEASETAS